LRGGAVAILAAKGPRSLRQHDCFLEEGRGGEPPPRITWYGMMKPHLTSHTQDPSWFIGLGFDLLSRGSLPAPPYNAMVTAVDSEFGQSPRLGHFLGLAFALLWGQ
jgi:hypothetical protein